MFSLLIDLGFEISLVLLLTIFAFFEEIVLDLTYEGC